MKTAAPVVTMKDVGQVGESPLDLLSDMENLTANKNGGTMNAVQELVKIAKSVVAVTQRPYFKGCAAIIAREVVDTGKSQGWIVVNRDAPNFLNTYNSARDAEMTLGRFNIGYQDDMFGEWGYERGGSDFFQKGGEFDGGN